MTHDQWKQLGDAADVLITVGTKLLESQPMMSERLTQLGYEVWFALDNGAGDPVAPRPPSPADQAISDLVNGKLTTAEFKARMREIREKRP